MIVPKTAVRNREIFVAFQHGKSIEDLAKQYELFEATIREIIRIERHKIAVSVDAFYEGMRTQKTAVGIVNQKDAIGRRCRVGDLSDVEAEQR